MTEVAPGRLGAQTFHTMKERRPEEKNCESDFKIRCTTVTSATDKGVRLGASNKKRKNKSGRERIKNQNEDTGI